MSQSERTLNGNVAIVTGAGRGAGRAIARRLAAADMRIVAVARTAAHVEAIAAEIAQAGGACLPVAADVSRETDVQRLADQTLDRFGRIDVLINNAGIGLHAPVAEMTLADWERVLATNLTGVFLCSRAVLPAMRRQGGGAIINISSGAGKQGYATMAAYCASKFGLMGFAQALAAEVGDEHIKVCTITPGTIATEFGSATPQERAARNPDAKVLFPDDVAEAVLYLLRQSSHAWTQEMSLWPFARYNE
jgi:NAD(P)-dependent dehydrogenase (short-subunit alcohol dehydrogenase family)